MIIRSRIEPFVRRLQKGVPTIVKVLVSEFGFRAVLRSTTLLLAVLAAVIVTGALAAYMHSQLIAALLVFVCFAIWPFRSMAPIGQVLCASGIIRENLSQMQGARRCFLAASRLLADPAKAYAGLYRIAETDAELRDLARWIQNRQPHPSQQTALLIARCWREAHDFESALRAFEIAEQLAPSDSVRLELSEAYLMTGAAQSCLEVLDRVAVPDNNGHYFFLRASALRCLDRLDDALHAANRATKIRPCNPDYHIEKGRILEALGRLPAAERQYSKAIRVHPRHAEAHFRRARTSLLLHNTASAVRDLERCYELENTRVDAYMLAAGIKADVNLPIIPVASSPNSPGVSVDPEEFEIIKGQTTFVRICIATNVELENCRLEVLEPFGWGVEVSPRQVSLGSISADLPKNVTIQVKAKRAGQVNLNQAWSLNVIVTAGNRWASKLIRVRVADPTEGRAFLVLTNDHEPCLHRDRLRSGTKWPILPEETQTDLVDKGQRANALAEKYSFKWTYFLDAGTALGLLRWAGSLTQSWEYVRASAEEFYQRACLAGHDWQLHLHLAGLPESYFFCYGHEPIGDVVSFDVAKKESYFPAWGVNSWANVLRRYGRAGQVDTRIGSLVLASKAVASLREGADGARQPVLFRAGQWDLGSSTAEREKSIMALRECAFLADSSVSEGYNCYERPFRFGSPAGQTPYFTFRNNPEKRAKRLSDAGFLEVIPCLAPNGAATTPQDSPQAVVQAYRGFTNGKRIAPGRHILMEIEHLSTIRLQNGDASVGWEAMDRHFATVRHKCPRLEGTTAEEAVYAWLDYYSPEPVVRLGTPESTTREGRDFLVFHLTFLGDGILGQNARRYEVAIPLPVPNPRWTGRMRILEDAKLVCDIKAHDSRQVFVQLDLKEDNRLAFTLELELASLDATVGANELARVG